MSVLTITERPLASAEPAAAPTIGSSWVRLTAWLPVLSALLSVLVSEPALMLIGLVLAAQRPWRRAASTVPALLLGVLTCITLSAAAGFAADLLRVDLLGYAGRPAAAALVVVCWASSFVRTPARAVPVRPDRLLALLPAAVCGVAAVAHAASTQRTLTWMFSGTDFSEHTRMLAELQRSGRLDLGGGYPQGLHMLLALSSAVGERGDHLASDLRLLATAGWLALGLLTAVLSATVLWLTRDRLGTWPAAVTATLPGLALLLSWHFMVSVFSLGSAPGLLAATSVWTVPLLIQQRRPVPWWARTAAAGLATAALANLWQALLPLPLLGLLAPLLSRAERKGLAREAAELARPRVLLAAGGGAAALLCVTAAPLVGLLTSVGLAQAAVPGTIATAPVAVVVLCLAAAVVPHLSPWRRTPWDSASTSWAGTAAALGLSLALLMHEAGHGWSLDAYYPRKAFWFCLVLVLPHGCAAAGRLVVPLVAVLWNRLALFGAAVRVLRATAVLVPLAAAAAFLLPVLVVHGTFVSNSFTTPSPFAEGRLSLAQAQAQRFRPAVTVPVGVGVTSLPDHMASYQVSKLMSAETGQPVATGDVQYPCASVRATAQDGLAVVVTELPAGLLAQLMQMQGCGQVPVVHLDTGDPGGVSILAAKLQTLLEQTPR